MAGGKDEYPLPVDHLGKHEAETLICPECRFERPATADEIMLGEPEDFTACPNDDTGLVFKYAEASRCPSCDRLGWWITPYSDGTCSFTCHCQAEYRASLETVSGSKG